MRYVYLVQIGKQDVHDDIEENETIAFSSYKKAVAEIVKQRDNINKNDENSFFKGLPFKYDDETSADAETLENFWAESINECGVYIWMLIERKELL